MVCLLEGVGMRFVCCEFGMSLKTLCNAGDCYEEFYKESLGEWAKWAFRFGEKLPFMLEIACVSLEREKPRWKKPGIWASFRSAGSRRRSTSRWQVPPGRCGPPHARPAVGRAPTSSTGWRFDAFTTWFNVARPRKASGMREPAEVRAHR